MRRVGEGLIGILDGFRDLGFNISEKVYVIEREKVDISLII